MSKYIDRNLPAIIYMLCSCLLGILIGIFSISFSPSCNMQEYQIRLEKDSAYVYDKGKLVGVTAHGRDGIDAILLMDNQ